MQQEIDEYYGIRDGHINEFEIHDMGDVAHALVKARIARGWTQKRLADALDVTEQMVQRDEAGGYKRAGLTRLAEAADVLEYRLDGALRPIEAPDWTIAVVPQAAAATRVSAAIGEGWVTTFGADKPISMTFGSLGLGDFFRGHHVADQIEITMCDLQQGFHAGVISSNVYSSIQSIVYAESTDTEGSVK